MMIRERNDRPAQSDAVDATAYEQAHNSAPAADAIMAGVVHDGAQAAPADAGRLLARYTPTAFSDSELLDWLEQRARKSPTGISFDWVPHCEDEPSGFRFMRRHFIGEPRKSLRSAIVAAMGGVEVRERIALAKGDAA